MVLCLSNRTCLSPAALLSDVGLSHYCHSVSNNYRHNELLCVCPLAPPPLSKPLLLLLFICVYLIDANMLTATYPVQFDEDAGLTSAVTIETIRNPRTVLQHGPIKLTGTLGIVPDLQRVRQAGRE